MIMSMGQFMCIVVVWLSEITKCAKAQENRKLVIEKSVFQLNNKTK